MMTWSLHPKPVHTLLILATICYHVHRKRRDPIGSSSWETVISGGGIAQVAEGSHRTP